MEGSGTHRSSGPSISISPNTVILVVIICSWVILGVVDEEVGSPSTKSCDLARSSCTGPAPFKPLSSITTDVAEASGLAITSEMSANNKSSVIDSYALSRPIPSMPCQHKSKKNHFKHSSKHPLAHNAGCSCYEVEKYSSYSGMCNRRMHGDNMHKVGGMNDTQRTHKNECRSPVSGPYIDEDQNSPLSAPSSLPRFWISLMHVMLGIPGLLYLELARFVFQLLGFRTTRVTNQSQSKAILTAEAWDALWETIINN
ncbi:peroxisomal membrane protein 13 [Tanacetum coccineum]